MKYRYPKYPSAPVYNNPNKENTAPGKNVLLNWSLLIKQATIITREAIENGTGKLFGVVNTTWFISIQCVPLDL